MQMSCPTYRCFKQIIKTTCIPQRAAFTRSHPLLRTKFSVILSLHGNRFRKSSKNTYHHFEVWIHLSKFPRLIADACWRMRHKVCLCWTFPIIGRDAIHKKNAYFGSKVVRDPASSPDLTAGTSPINSGGMPRELESPRCSWPGSLWSVEVDNADLKDIVAIRCWKIRAAEAAIAASFTIDYLQRQQVCWSQYCPNEFRMYRHRSMLASYILTSCTNIFNL